LFDAFYDNEEKRTCQKCGAVHPGRSPPEGWVSI
jgi:3-hydroxyanthranilate 3,4-dioxygenase